MPKYQNVSRFFEANAIFKITEVVDIDDAFGPVRGRWVFPIPTSRFRVCSTAKGIVVHRVGGAERAGASRRYLDLSSVYTSPQPAAPLTPRKEISGNVEMWKMWYEYLSVK